MNKQLPCLLKSYLNLFFKVAPVITVQRSIILHLRPPNRKVLTRPLDNLKTRKAMNAKFLGYFIYVETIIYLLLHNCMISLLIKWSFLLVQNSHLAVTRYWHNLLVCHEEALSNILQITDINEGLSTNLVVYQVNGKNEWEVCQKTMSFLRVHIINSSVAKVAATRGDPSTTVQPWECKSQSPM